MFELPDVEFDILLVLPDDDPVNALFEPLDVDVVEDHLDQLLDDVRDVLRIPLDDLEDDLIEPLDGVVEGSSGPTL